MLAELEFHILDEHKHGAAKTRSQRHIAGAPCATSAMVPPLTLTIPMPPISQQQPDSGCEMLQRDDNLASSAGLAEGSLDNIVEGLLGLIGAEENIGPWPIRSTASPIKLSELFDFTVGYWLETTESTGFRGLQDELEFYELLDMDMDGSDEQDTDVPVDGMSEAVLTSN